jgi:HSP20 family protein
MTVITRWDPFRELATLQDRMNRLFQQTANSGETSLTTAGAFVPPVDGYEDEQGLRLKLEVPGIDEKNLDVRIENNVLTIRGEGKFEKEEKEENFRRVERSYGSFVRSFSLPQSIDTENVSADHKKRRFDLANGETRRGQAEADQSQHRLAACFRSQKVHRRVRLATHFSGVLAPAVKEVATHLLVFSLRRQHDNPCADQV